LSQINRKFPRLSIDIPASLQMEDGTIYKGHTRNISYGGIYFKSEELDIRYRVTPKEDDKGAILILYNNDDEIIAAKIPCAIAHNDSQGAGIAFTGLSDNNHSALKDIFKSNLCSEDYSEYRQHERFGLKFPGRFKTEGGAIFQGISSDISFGGLFFQLSRQSAQNLYDQQVNLELILSKSNNEKFECICRVMHSSKNGVGLSFEKMDEINSERIKKHLKEARKNNWA
jgi:hypothetical protein